jgi:pimeloyl-ACP methyl ester carboxylesterase
MQTHFILRTLNSAERPDKEVQALLAVQPLNKAVIFVHGFSGDPITTWSDFPVLLPARQQCAGHDFFFYGYDGLRANTNSSAALLRNFVDRLLSGTSSLVNDSLPTDGQRPEDFEYTKVLFVAHSLGAVIIRRALLDLTQMDLTEKRRPWLANSKMVLFAPAHTGASVVDLALEVTTGMGFIKSFVGIVQFLSPLIKELKPNSIVLHDLLADTKKARLGGANPHLRAQKVVFAEIDNIVETIRFADDPPEDAIPGTRHTTVCKPSTDFLRPLEIVEQYL